MKECDGGRRWCWACAVEQPGFSIVEVLFTHHICCARDGKSWLCRNDQAHRIEEDILFEVKRFEGGNHRQPDGKVYNIARSLHRYRLHACASCGVLWSQSPVTVTCVQPVDLNLCDPRGDLLTIQLWLYVLAEIILHHKMHRHVIYSGANSRRDCTSCRRVVCGALQIKKPRVLNHVFFLRRQPQIFENVTLERIPLEKRPKRAKYRHLLKAPDLNFGTGHAEVFGCVSGQDVVGS